MKYQPTRLRRLERVWLNHGQPTYFVTICVAQKRPNTLANDAVHTRLREFLLATAPHHNWWASRYVLMPDHLHLLAAPGLEAVTLGAWIKALKSCVANREFKWQAGFFDHILRSDESQSEKWEYIRNNPVRAGLVAEAEAWPFGGEIVLEDGMANNLPRQETRPTSQLSLDVGRVSSPGDAPDISTSPANSSAAQSAEIVRYETGTSAHPQLDYLAAEEPLELRIEGHSVAVVMRTPGHDRELAAGFLLSENLVRAASDIFDITQCGDVGRVSRPGGPATISAPTARAFPPDNSAANVVNVTLRNPDSFDPKKLTRNVFSSSSCGVCSKATIDAVRQSFPPVMSDCRVSAETLLRLPAALRERQETFNQTGGLHACALFDLQGNLEAIREDVGRHNALDKLIGRALLENQLPLRECVLLLSGRVSFEMMQKALAAGIPIVAAISAPTSLAVEFARANNQTLVGFLRGAQMNIYAGAERILEGAAPSAP